MHTEVIHIPLYLINASIFVSNYCILFVQAPVMFIFYNAKCSNFEICKNGTAVLWRCEYANIVLQIWLMHLISSNRRRERPHMHMSSRLTTAVCLSLPPRRTRVRRMKIRSREWWDRIMLMEFTDSEWREKFQTTRASSCLCDMRDIIWRFIYLFFFPLASVCAGSCNCQKLG